MALLHLDMGKLTSHQIVTAMDGSVEITAQLQQILIPIIQITLQHSLIGTQSMFIYRRILTCSRCPGPHSGSGGQPHVQHQGHSSRDVAHI